MKRAQETHLNLTTTAGPRLRCFLGLAWRLPLLGLAFCCSLHAQLDVPGPLHLTHVEGFVVTSQGKPLVNTEVTLVRDDAVAHTTRTDNAGAFHFDHVSGRYWFRVARSDYAPAAREVYIEPEIVTALQRKKLYVIVGPGACSDECSSVFSDKHDLDRALQKLNRH